MSEISIMPFGNLGEMPEGIPVINDLTTGGAANALSAQMGKKLSAIAHRNEVFVAASNATESDKLAADYQCSGTHDELIIQAAVNSIYAKRGGTVRLSSGTFYIDSFPNYESRDDGGSYTAILIPSDTTAYQIKIIGEIPYGSSGTNIKVTDSCYESLDPTKKYKIFRTAYVSRLTAGGRVSLFLMNMAIRLPWNQKKIMCIDLLYCNRACVNYVTAHAYTSGYNNTTVSLQNPPPVAVEDCVGIRMTGGSNAGLIADYRYMNICGFYEAYKVGGEHVTCVKLGGSFNVYCYTFGNYPWSEGFNHPITMINCSQEHCVNMPYFAYCSESRQNLSSGQQIVMIEFNTESIAAYTPGGTVGEAAKEKDPGTFHGEVSYTIQIAHGGSSPVLSTTKKFWKDGHGQRFISRNSAQLLACDTATRNSYAPNYLQRIWDTTLGKEVICVDTANKTWKDAMGNTV